MTTNLPEPSLEQLEKMNEIHKKDLRLLKHMSDAQFKVFRKNTSIGVLENITKAEAYELLLSMLALNQHLREIATKKQKNKN